METICPKTPTCVLFNDNLLKRKESAETYKLLFCRTDEKYKQCKRYMISERVGKCPYFVMPNSSLSIDNIIERMKREGLL